MLTLQTLCSATKCLFRLSLNNNYATKTLFLGNLSKAALDEEVRILFEKKVPVTSVYVPKSYNGNNRGFAFVEIDEALVGEALSLRGSELLGEPIRLEIAKSKRAKPYVA